MLQGSRKNRGRASSSGAVYYQILSQSAEITSKMFHRFPKNFGFLFAWGAGRSAKRVPRIQGMTYPGFGVPRRPKIELEMHSHMPYKAREQTHKIEGKRIIIFDYIQ